MSAYKTPQILIHYIRLLLQSQSERNAEAWLKANFVIKTWTTPRHSSSSEKLPGVIPHFSITLRLAFGEFISSSENRVFSVNRSFVYKQKLICFFKIPKNPHKYRIFSTFTCQGVSLWGNKNSFHIFVPKRLKPYHSVISLF